MLRSSLRVGTTSVISSMRMGSSGAFRKVETGPAVPEVATRGRVMPSGLLVLGLARPAEG